VNVRGFGVGAAMLAGCALVIAGCSSSAGSPGAAAGTAAGAGSSSTSSSTLTQPTSIGTVLADSSGRTMYELVGATSTSSACTGGCLSVWPAVTVNGTQLVVQGHPAYRYSGDSAAGQTNGQGLKDQWGTWWALDASGSPIVAGASASSSTGVGHGYNY
jgi:predicted lipoprotein with Yx(FWY)xxD motif